MAETKEKVIGKDETKPENQTEDNALLSKKILTLEKKLLEEAKMKEYGLVAYGRRMFQRYANSRRRYSWEWLSRDLFRRGYQFTRYNNSTRTVTLTTNSSARIPVNLTMAAMRSIASQVTAFRPKWEVLPNRLDTTAKVNAELTQKLLDFIYKVMRLKKSIKETVMQGLITSVGGAWQIGWDDKLKREDGGLGWLYIWNNDPFDFYVDPNCTDGLTFKDAEGVIKAVRRSLDDVKSNPNYENTQLLVTGDNKAAADEYKQFLLQSIKYIQQYQGDDAGTTIVYEGYFKFRQNGKAKIRQLTWVDNLALPLQNEILDTDDFPFRMYQADMNPLEVYGEGWAKHVIPINRVINILESSMFDYNYRYNKGRLVVDKNSGINFIDNQNGTIIEKNRGAMITSLPLQPLSNSSETQIMRMRQYFEDISGAHDVSLGRIPVGVHSGIGIAELKQADATNQDALVDNLQDFLIEVAKKVLKTISENVKTPIIIKTTTMGGQKDYFAIVGEKASGWKRGKDSIKIGKETYPLAVITEDNSIDVQIGSWLAYSKQQRQQELKDLYTSGVIDQKTLLEHLEFGDIETIIKRTQQESILKARRTGQEAGVKDKVSEEEIAVAETQMLIEGNTAVVPLPTDDHELHIAVHGSERENQLVLLHIEEHKALLRAQKGISETGGQQLGPEGVTGMEGLLPEGAQIMATSDQAQQEQQVNPVEQLMSQIGSQVPEAGAGPMGPMGPIEGQV